MDFDKFIFKQASAIKAVHMFSWQGPRESPPFYLAWISKECLFEIVVYCLQGALEDNGKTKLSFGPQDAYEEVKGSADMWKTFREECGGS